MRRRPNRGDSLLFALMMTALVTLPAHLSGQSPDSPDTPEPFQGLIQEEDPRASDIRRAILEGAAAPDQIHLRYSRTEGNYLVFYDLVGHEILFRYREDRWDRDAEKIPGSLSRGMAYRVTGRFTGVSLSGEFVQMDRENFGEFLENPDSRLVYIFTGATPLLLNEIIF